MRNNDAGGNIFTVPIAASALTTAGAYDLVGLTASSSGRLELLSMRLALASSQYTTFPALGLQLLRGSTVDSTGAAITPTNVKGWSVASTAQFTATGPCTALVSTASAVSVFADAFDAHGSWKYEPHEYERIHLTLGQRLHLRSSTPSIACTVYGTATVRDTARGLPS